MSIALASILCSAPHLGADDGPREGPHFVVDGPDQSVALPLIETRARVLIADVIGHVRVTQIYENTGEAPIEATYVFPGSAQAALFGLEMTVGDRTIVAEISKRDEARQKYDQAKREGRTASLLEQARPNVFAMRVGNILPKDRIEVRLDYTEHLIARDGIYELVYPTVVGPRYTGEAQRKEAWAVNPHYRPAGPSGSETSGPPLHLSARIVGGAPVAEVFSPSHQIAPRFIDDRTVEVQLDASRLDRDVVIRYRMGTSDLESGVLTYASGDGGYFLVTVQPPLRVPAAEVLPREYIFIVDVSGSMGGFPISVARELTTELVKGLRSIDRFNVLTFAGGNRVLFDASRPPTADNVARMQSVFRSGGGTHLLAALDRALAMPRQADRSTSFVLITDGYVSVEAEAFERVSGHLDRANLFVFGIGSSVNRSLIEGLALAGRGEPFVVLNEAEARSTARRFRRYIEAPVLTGVRVEIDGLDAYDVEPTKVPDVFAARPVVLYGRYRGTLQGRIVVSGRHGAGRFRKALTFDERSTNNDLVVLRQLWARQRIARLTYESHLGEDVEARITALGLKYDLLTAYTSFVAIDSAIRNHAGSPISVIQPLLVPDGVSTIGTSYAAGGLGVRGSGRGGGGLRHRSARGGAHGTARGGARGTGLGRSVGGYGSHIDLGGRGEGRTRMAPGRTVIRGPLSKQAIARVMRKNQGRFKFCYEKRLAHTPKLAGGVSLFFTIDQSGSVAKASVSESTLGSDAVESCLVKVVSSLRFPAPLGGAIVVVTYPMTFAPS